MARVAELTLLPVYNTFFLEMDTCYYTLLSCTRQIFILHTLFFSNGHLFAKIGHPQDTCYYTPLSCTRQIFILPVFCPRILASHENILPDRFFFLNSLPNLTKKMLNIHKTYLKRINIYKIWLLEVSIFKKIVSKRCPKGVQGVSTDFPNNHI